MSYHSSHFTSLKTYFHIRKPLVQQKRKAELKNDKNDLLRNYFEIISIFFEKLEF